MDRDHTGLPHGGSVLRSGVTGVNGEYLDTIEFTLNLESNPFFTGSVLTAVARAAYRLSQEGVSGGRTIFDIPPCYVAEAPREELIAHML
jgi:diaminopimelate dehydrogenase